MSLKVKTVNTPFERECKNCGAVTCEHYRLHLTTSDCRAACNMCMHKVISEVTNNGFTRGSISSNRMESGGIRSDWHKDIEPLSKQQLLRLIDDEFITRGEAIRKDSTILERPRNIPSDAEKRTYYDGMLSELRNDELIRETTIGVDDGIAYEPTLARQGEYVIELDLVTKWENDDSMQPNLIDVIVEEISNNTEYSIEELRSNE